MTVTCFPSQVAWICRHPDLSQYDFTSVRSISVTGSSIFPKYELEIYDKMPNLIRLSVVTQFVSTKQFFSINLA